MLVCVSVLALRSAGNLYWVYPALTQRPLGEETFFLLLRRFQVTKPGKLFVFIFTVLLGFGMRTT